MDQSLSDCIRNFLGAMIYDMYFVVVADRRCLGEDVEICGFRGEAESGNPLKKLISMLAGGTTEYVRTNQKKYVWFDVRITPAAAAPSGHRVWELMALVAVASAYGPLK